MNARKQRPSLFDCDPIGPPVAARTAELGDGHLSQILRALLYARRAGLSCSSARLAEITPLWREGLNRLATRGRLTHCEQRGCGWLVSLTR